MVQYTTIRMRMCQGTFSKENGACSSHHMIKLPQFTYALLYNCIAAIWHFQVSSFHSRFCYLYAIMLANLLFRQGIPRYLSSFATRFIRTSLKTTLTFNIRQYILHSNLLKILNSSDRAMQLNLHHLSEPPKGRF